MRQNTQQPGTPFGQWVQQVLDKHGATLRSQRQRTGLAHSTILNWMQDVRPQMEAVIAFARGFGEDVNGALQLAGYEPIQPATLDAALDQALDLAREELAYEPVDDPGAGNPYGGDTDLPPEGRLLVRRLLEKQRKAERGVAE